MARDWQMSAVRAFFGCGNPDTPNQSDKLLHHTQTKEREPPLFCAFILFLTMDIVSQSGQLCKLFCKKLEYLNICEKMEAKHIV